jgi:hypothetical protein
MPRIAIAFDTPADGIAAVDALLASACDPSLEVELVAMVDPLRSGKVAVFVSKARAASQARKAAARWLAPLAAALASAGVRCQTQVAIGPPARTLRQLAERTDLAQVIRPPGSSRGPGELPAATRKVGGPAVTALP